MSNPILDLIEQQNAIDEKAWVAFNEDYSRRNPSPNDNGLSWRYQMIRVGAVSALIVSGSLTIPAFKTVALAAGMNVLLSWFVGFASFLMIDVLLFVAAHQIVDMVYRPQALTGKMDQKMIMIYVSIMGVFGFIVGVASNMYFVLIGFEVMDLASSAGQGFSIFLGILMAFAPPIQSATAGAIIALVPLSSIIERESYERSKQSAWHRFKRSKGLNLDVQKITEQMMENAINRLGYVPNQQLETVSNSNSTSNSAQSLKKKVAINYLQNDQDKYMDIRQSVLDSNPTANQIDIAKAIAKEMSGDEKGYMTVMRACKDLDIEL